MAQEKSDLCGPPAHPVALREAAVHVRPDSEVGVGRKHTQWEEMVARLPRLACR